MKRIPVSTTTDHLNRVSTCGNSINAVAELLWNSLDAGANNISVIFNTTPLGSIERIEIQDDGFGIDATHIESLFGSLGDSWKKNTEKFKNRPLHGKKGEGRFKAFSLGDSVTWETVYEDENDKKHYGFTIHGTKNDKTFFSCDEPKECSDSAGTKVVITSTSNKLGKLIDDQSINQFTVIFAGYLQKFPDVTINMNGTRIIPGDHCTVVYLKRLPSVKTEDGTEYSVNVEVIEWDISVPRKIQLCDDSGIELQEEDVKIQAKGENFSIRIRSDYFKVLDQQNQLMIGSLSTEVQNIIEASRNVARGYFRRKKAAEAANIVQQWKEENIYPFENKAEKDLSAVELAERQVFDIIGVNVQDFLPDFEKADNASKKFTFCLLAQALKNNPESLQKILTEVLDLDAEKQKDLADLLDKTDLSNIIKCAKTVSDRLNFIFGLENLLFDKETKKALLERDQLHKILEKEAWIFDENFTLSASEATLNEVLNIHLDKLGKMSDDDSPVTQADGRTGRVDLFFGLATCPRHGERDHLVVELKRPSKKIDLDVITQITGYANAIADDPRFDKETTHWKVIAVSNEIDSSCQRQTHQTGQPAGRIMLSDNLEVWAFSWAQILNEAKAKLAFLNNSLCYEADRDSSKKYLMEKHEKFIPKVAQEEDSTCENDTSDITEEPEDNHA